MGGFRVDYILAGVAVCQLGFSILVVWVSQRAIDTSLRELARIMHGRDERFQRIEDGQASIIERTNDIQQTLDNYSLRWEERWADRHKEFWKEGC